MARGVRKQNPPADRDPATVIRMLVRDQNVINAKRREPAR